MPEVDPILESMNGNIARIEEKIAEIEKGGPIQMQMESSAHSVADRLKDLRAACADAIRRRDEYASRNDSG
jgi:hypothetical protein